MRTSDTEIIVVGAGVVGLSIARRLKLLGHEVLLLDRQPKAGMEISSRNSEVIHAGLYYPPGSLRARCCIAGRRALLDYCELAGVPVAKTGKLIVASCPEEAASLERLRDNAERSGAGVLQTLTRDEARAQEPELECAAALFSPGTAVLDSHQLLLALEGDFTNAGGTIAYNTAIEGLSRDEDVFRVDTVGGDGTSASLTSDRLVIAAGLGAQTLGGMLVYEAGYALPPLYPAKGHYYTLLGRAPFRHLIYPVPNGAWLGIHLTLDTGGGVRFGPDVEWCERIDYAFDDQDGARRARFERDIRRWWPGLPDGALAPGSTGIRPKLYAEGDPPADFAVHGSAEHGVAGLVALYGIESPGLTSAFALADLAVEMLGV